ncbi:MAG: hypothetical protein DMF04_04845 [Verrucomicrobia bacterium]|nr:MAG: hypothetical protein DMF04_04845 [Verrucomicrobiota bacterium]
MFKDLGEALASVSATSALAPVLRWEAEFSEEVVVARVKCCDNEAATEGEACAFSDRVTLAHLRVR